MLRNQPRHKKSKPFFLFAYLVCSHVQVLGIRLVGIWCRQSEGLCTYLLNYICIHALILLLYYNCMLPVVMNQSFHVHTFGQRYLPLLVGFTEAD